jgi:hypothetical protein
VKIECHASPSLCSRPVIFPKRLLLFSRILFRRASLAAAALSNSGVSVSGSIEFQFCPFATTKTNFVSNCPTDGDAKAQKRRDKKTRKRKKNKKVFIYLSDLM